MKFQFSKLGNRIAVKTVRKTYSKVTYLTVEEAKKTFKKINHNGWNVEFIDDSVKIIL